MQMLKPSEVNNHNEKSRMIEHFMAQVKQEDLINVGFMKPIQVALRTHKNDKDIPADSLPRGLMLAVKSSINDNKYSIKRLTPIESEHCLLYDLKQKHMDNYISLLKKPEEKDQIEAQRISQRVSMVPEGQPEHRQPKHQGLEIGICVSMAGEDKKNLKSTLIGVADNIDELIRSGVSPDDIFVVVIMDGVTKVDPSIYQYFQQFQRESQIFLEEDELLSLRKKYEHQQFHSEVQKDQPLNYSKFLFKKDQFHERIDSKFINIRKKYDQILRIKNSIQNIKKQNNKDNDNLKMIVNRLADKQKTILKKINLGKPQKSLVINEQSIMKQLASSQEECNQYINTRQDLAYVSVYRLPTTSLSEDCRLKEIELHEREAAQIESQLDSQRLMNEQIQRETIRQSLRNNNGTVSKHARYVNLFFCIKYKQAGKLNSHNWFLNGFCQQLNPRYAFLLDVGVRAYPDAIFKMYRHMRINQNVGGVCGYLRLVEELVEDEQKIKEEEVDCMTSCLWNLFDIQRAQQIECHYEHFLDKSFEAVFKFIHVVPGAFSGYNMSALRPPGKKDELLREYFRSIDDKMIVNKIVPSEYKLKSILARIFLPKTLWKLIDKVDPDSQQQLLYNQNTYQAENRILCLGIHKNKKDIVFMPNVFAQVEPLKHINELMDHKKLEINGGLFSFEKVQKEFEDVTMKREKFLVRFQLFYLSCLKFLSFFAPSLFIFTLQFAVEIIQNEFLANLFATESPNGIGTVLYLTFESIVLFIYSICLLTIFFFSIHLKASDKKYVYYAHLTSTILGLFAVIAAVVFIIESFFSWFAVGNSYLHQQYLVQLETFLPPASAIIIVNLLKVFLVTTGLMILLPMLCYSIAFKKFGVLWEVMVGIPSYIFYFPTYVCVLPIYAKCRLDDVYSGGKSSAGAKNQKLHQSWKIVKMIDVAKYLFWNCIVGITLLSLQSILLVKFFLLIFLLLLFTIILLIKWIPGLIYIIQYNINQTSNPLEPTVEERENTINQMKFRIFDTIKKFEEDFTHSIGQSFQEAANDAEEKEMEKQSKKEAGGKKNAPQTPQLQVPKPTKNRKESIDIGNILEVNQEPNLSSKVPNMRESSAVKGNFYPFQFGGMKKDQKAVNVQPANLPLEMLLLKNKMETEVMKNSELKEEEHKLKKYENFRTTIRPLGF